MQRGSTAGQRAGATLIDPEARSETISRKKESRSKEEESAILYQVSTVGSPESSAQVKFAAPCKTRFESNANSYMVLRPPARTVIPPSQNAAFAYLRPPSARRAPTVYLCLTQPRGRVSLPPLSSSSSPKVQASSIAAWAFTDWSCACFIARIIREVPGGRRTRSPTIDRRRPVCRRLSPAEHLRGRSSRYMALD